MPSERIRISNEFVGLAFDSLTGELLELVNNRSGDNLLKNWSNKRSMPFALLIADQAGRSCLATAPNYKNVLENVRLRPGFELSTDHSGTKHLEIRYDRLLTELGELRVKLAIHVSIAPGDYETRWTIRLKNEEDGCTVEQVRFPCLFGVYHGETWADDVLVFPYNSGEKIENPVEAYERSSSVIGWKWQEYKYEYCKDAVRTVKDKDDAYTREFRYSGPLSMMWLDYYDEQQGLYFASYDDSFHVAALHCETFGVSRPGMGFYAIRFPYVASGCEWNSNPFVVAVHPGDWHWGAERYREWRRSVSDKQRFPAPDWVARSPGLVAHYDFKYQNGNIVHRFRDLPEIYRQAKEMGMNHLLLSGWHIDGFDNGFPKYRPDPDLGTEEELIEHVQAIRRTGGHVAFYVNSRLFNRKYHELEDLMKEGAVVDRKGVVKTERYGNDDITFAVMCSCSTIWQQHLYETVRYLVETVGADSIYLDQLGMAPPELCFNSAHRHAPDGWNQGYGDLLDRIRSEFQIGLIYEGVTDIHGSKTVGQLISTFHHHHVGAFPELYRYTFPEQLLVDMVYPSRGQVMRPVHVSQVSREMIDRTFLLGCYMWVYDLEEDNTFRNDPDSYDYLCKVLRLRSAWLDRFGYGTYQDDTRIIRVEPDIKAKRFELDNGDDLFAVSTQTHSGIWSLDWSTGGRNVREAVLYELGNEHVGRKLDVLSASGEGSDIARLETASSRLALVHVRYAVG